MLDTFIHHYFERRASAEPSRQAIVTDGAALTYGQLNRRANQLAHHLVASGAVGRCVAVYLDRTVALPIAVVAVWKAGATFVSLDPAHPPARGAEILEDTGAEFVISTGALFGPLKSSLTTAPRLLDLDADGGLVETLEACPGDNLVVAGDPDAVALAIYTSGSTGRPKGVAIAHRTFAARYDRSPYLHLIGMNSVVAAITDVSWNPFFYEILFTLAAGATVALAPRDIVRDPSKLIVFLAKHHVDFMRAVPSLWQALVDAGWTGTPNFSIVCHGEHLGVSLHQALAGSGRGVWNTYGSTEASTFLRLELGSDGKHVIPCDDALFHPVGVDGKGDAATTVAVLRDDLSLAAPHEVGEVCIGGPIVADGYLGQPEETVACFRPLPVGHESGLTRVYRTGDLGRGLGDGRIELLGRADGQVKIRGHRVEVREVEAVVVRHPEVRECVVVARDDAMGWKYLVAYVILRAGSVSSEATLRAFAAAQSPASMVPQVFVLLDSFPLNDNGKVDRPALPPPPRTRPGASPAFVSPASEAEAALASIFGEVLGLDAVGVDDDFFASGGHSLAAAQVMARVADALGVVVPLTALFARATARSLAAELPKWGLAGAEASALRLVSVAARTWASLSFAQERLWFLNRLNPGDFAYNLPMAFRLRGELDAAALTRALGAVVGRHEALRTAFGCDEGGRPVQSVVDVARLDVPFMDLNGLSEAEALVLAASEAAMAAIEPFDLSAAPLFRARIYRISTSDHVLFVNMHHIASDGWSKGILRRDLGAFYRGEVGSAAPPLPVLSAQYLDFAAWQRQSLAGPEYQRQLAYWRVALAGVETLELPTDRLRPPVFSHRGAREVRLLPARLLVAAKDYAATHGATLFMVLLAAFKVVLHRHSGQTDLLVGSPIAGRRATATEDLIGFFVNTLALRTACDPAISFDALVQRVKTTALGAFDHQDLPFERLVAELNPARDPARPPLVQTVFALQSAPGATLSLPGVTSEPFDIPNVITRLELELHVWEVPAGLLCHLIYSTDIFDAWRAEQLICHFERALTEVLAVPTIAVGDVDLLGDADRHRILVAWNATERASPEVCLHQVLSDLATGDPERLAVADGHHRLSYGQLHRAADLLAQRLLARGVKPATLIGVLAERSAEYVVACLGIWKAGAAFVPIDPAYPAARRALIIADAGLEVIVTSPAHAATVAASNGEGIIVEIGVLLAAPARPVATVTPSLDRLAYVIYTSGSTGRPNGAMITHRNLADTVAWYRETHALGPTDRASFMASPAFDASILEVWPCLTAGASLHIPDDDTRRRPARLASWLDTAGVTIAFLSPPMLEAFVDLGAPSPRALRLVTTGGDRLTRRPPEGAPWALVNHYGPTETAICVTAHPVLASDAWDARQPPIGRPLSNTKLYVLDARGLPVPAGVQGELYISGAGVGEGYWKNPELTARQFVPNTFGPGRLYRTGDRVRYMPNGDLLFVGRADAQVKLRGFRVEPGDIDAVLVGAPGVASAVTALYEDPRRGPRLVSYLVAASPTIESERALALETVARWQVIYDETYRAPADSDSASIGTEDPEFQIAGWNSSFTGQPIPAAEMREWVDGTVAAVVAMKPRSVLEVGCGTGLLLYPLTRVVERYAAVDISHRAVDAIRAQLLASTHGRSSSLDLGVAPAHALGDLGRDAQFDTIIMNSVAQYFPSAAYLSDVIEDLVDRASPNARILIGDVRNFDLFEAFHQGVERARGGTIIDSVSFSARVAMRMRHDKELLLAPAFFHVLGASIPRVTAVEVRPRRGRARNEMGMFRYDVTLVLDATPTPLDVGTRVHHWQTDGGEAAFRASLASHRPTLWTAVPDARLAGVFASSAPGVDLEALIEYAKYAGMRCDIRLQPGSRAVDVCCIPDDLKGPVTLPQLAKAPTETGPSASDPLASGRRQALIATVRAHAATQLPEHMVPSVFVCVDAIPTTPHGKVDWRALPQPETAQTQDDEAAEPATSTEDALARVFAEALGAGSCGVNANFFGLGGHSLLAVQVISRAEDVFGISLPLATLFEAPTVRGLAARIDALRATRVLDQRCQPPTNSAIQALPLTPMDVNFHYGRLYLRAQDRAWFQVLEIALASPEVSRLGAAIVVALNAHPIARGRISAAEALGASAFWDVSARVSVAPLTVVDARDQAHAGELREITLTSPIPLDEAPAFRFTLVRLGATGTLFVRYNHGTLDGSGLICLLDAIWASYLGRPDPARRVLPFTTDELFAIHEYRQPGQRLASWLDNRELSWLRAFLPSPLLVALGAAGARKGPRFLAPRPLPSRIAPSGGDGESTRCERIEVAFTGLESAALRASVRAHETTLDRAFVVGLLRGASAWNASHGASTESLQAYWAVNLRPPRDFRSVVANHFAWSRVEAPSPDEAESWTKAMLDPANDTLVRGALDWLAFVDAFHHLKIPRALRRLIMGSVKRTAPAMAISNTLAFGELGASALAEAAGVLSVAQHSRFFVTDRPTLFIASRGGLFVLRMAYPRSVFDAAGALQFVLCCKDSVLAHSA